MAEARSCTPPSDRTSSITGSIRRNKIYGRMPGLTGEMTMAALLPLLWTIISYNDFMLPRLLWGVVSSGSAS
ncbi:hypothetical protein [Nocardia sp. CY41]|uniref:hypothetical protein n=1 Tax=Nocardia sp. CY41 TaxID=2608686 RepID=UPI0013578365|nr:hypothetical protein [Nocardia sp. CY41]